QYGQSHPLRSQMIAPGSYAKLIFPPPRPRVQGWGPSFGIGVSGYHVSRVDHHYVTVPGPVYSEPQYFDVYDDSNALYWDWSGESDVRVILMFHRGESTFAQEFGFHRVKL